MQINESELNKSENSKSFIYPINDTHVTFVARKNDNENVIRVTAQIRKIDGVLNQQTSRALENVHTWKEAGDSIDKLCKMYAYSCKLNPELNDLKIIEFMQEDLCNSTGQKQKRLNCYSPDGKYRFFVKKEGDVFTPKVRRLSDNIEGYLHPSVCTEDEANRIVEKQWNNYGTKGCFCRKLTRKPKIVFEDECPQEKSHQSKLHNTVTDSTNRKEIFLKLVTELMEFVERNY